MSPLNCLPQGGGGARKQENEEKQTERQDHAEPREEHVAVAAHEPKLKANKKTSPEEKHASRKSSSAFHNW